MARRSRGAPRARAFAAMTIAAALAVGGCASVPTAPTVTAPATDARFDVSGRFSARGGAEAVAGRFDWQHDPSSDRLSFASPLGQSLAQLSGSDGGVELRLADGRVEQAPDWQALTRRALGVPLPVDGLKYWMRGLPRPGAAHREERDAKGRVELMRQDGWEIVYGYAADDASAPARLKLTYPDVDVRLAIETWR